MNLSFRHGVLTSRTLGSRASAAASVLGVILALASVSSVAAQDMSFDVDEAESGTSKSDKGKGKSKKDKKADKADAADDKAAAAAGGEAKGDGQMEMGASGGDLLSELTAEKTDDAATSEGGLAREKESIEKIYAVQRMYVLRNGRFELAPSLAQTFNDQYVSHPSIGAGLNYWITNVLAVGVNFLWYQGIETEAKLTFSIRRSTRLAVPITEYQMGGHLNFTYVPIYGKFEMFNDAIFQWDGYLIGGVGMLRTRPVAVIDPAVRTFDFQWRVAFNAGIGLRVFVTKWLSIFGELRDYLYMEKLENLEVSLSQRGEPSTWTDQNSKLTNNVTVALGFSMFFPFTFSYSYPK